MRFRENAPNIISAAIIAALSYLFVITPLYSDIRVFLGAARHADLWGAFPFGVDVIWEIKPMGNKLLFYGIYKISSTFASIPSLEFEMWCKIIYMALAVAIVLLFINRQRNGMLKDLAHPYLVIWSVLFTVSYFCQMQVEYTCIFLVILAVTLVAEPNILSKIAGGIVASILLPMKGVTVLLAPVVPIILDDGKWYYWAGIAAGITATAVIAIILPHVIPDIILSAKIQGSMTSPGFYVTRMYFLCAYYQSAVTHIPFLIMIPITAVVWVLALIKKRAYEEFAACVIVWVLAVAVILVQGKFSLYHYLVLIIPLAYSLYLNAKLLNLWKYEAVVPALMIIMFSAMQSGALTDPDHPDLRIADNIRESKERIASYSAWNTTKNTPVLYLDGGLAQYYLGKKGVSRYSLLEAVWYSGDGDMLCRFYDNATVVGGMGEFRSFCKR